MDKITDVIAKLPNVVSLGGVGIDIIRNAEKELNLLFADDYKEYLENFGVISFDGGEINGVTTIKRLSVVDSTKYVRSVSDIPNDYYVIEDLSIDGVLVLQNKEGRVFRFQPNHEIQCVAESLSMYLLQYRNI